MTCIHGRIACHIRNAHTSRCPKKKKSGRRRRIEKEKTAKEKVILRGCGRYFFGGAAFYMFSLLHSSGLTNIINLLCGFLTPKQDRSHKTIGNWYITWCVLLCFARFFTACLFFAAFDVGRSNGWCLDGYGLPFYVRSGAGLCVLVAASMSVLVCRCHRSMYLLSCKYVIKPANVAFQFSVWAVAFLNCAAEMMVTCTEEGLELIAYGLPCFWHVCAQQQPRRHPNW